jgi:SAM-dependent methyltransferase
MSKSQSLSVTADAAADKYDRLLSRFAASGFPPLIIAVGLTNQLLDALDRRQARSKVLAIEPVPAVHQQKLTRPEWRAWIDSGRLTVLAGPDYEGFQDAWRLIGREAMQPPMIVDPELLEKFPTQAESGKAVAKQIVRGAHANEEARKRFAGGYLLNTLANLPVIASEANASALADLFNGVPAIVIGAGPSLDDNLPALQALQDRVLLVAVDTAVRPLLAAGIRPHLVVSVDPSDANARHLNDLPDVRGLWFVGEGSLTPSVFPQFKGRTFVYKVSNHEPWPWLAEHGADRAQLHTWGSVLTTAFDIALKAGCDPIAFAGSDLAYTGGLQYCRNTVYEPDWSPFPTNAERAAEFAKYLQTRPHLTQPDIEGGDTITAPHFVQFRDWIVARAASAAPRRIINATGAGILHGGSVETRDLESLEIAALPGEDGNLRERLANAWTTATIAHTEVRARVERAVAYGAAIPFQQWQEFGGDSTTVDRLRHTVQSAAGRLGFDRRTAAYLTQLRDSYDQRIATLEDARELSHGSYGVASERATAQQAHVFLDFLQRTYECREAGLDNVLVTMLGAPRSIRALDVGCGVGRLMEPLLEIGAAVDGVDISEQMLHFARQNPKLQQSSLFLSRGHDCGSAPDGAYDLVYSQLCFRYIRSRTVRQQLLHAIARALRPGGVVVVEMRFFRGLSAATIPPPHVPWSAEECETTVEAGAADVCPTADELHLVYEDFSRHFEDLRLQFVEVPAPVRGHLPVQLFVSGSTRGDLVSRIHALQPASQAAPPR